MGAGTVQYPQTIQCMLYYINTFKNENYMITLIDLEFLTKFNTHSTRG